jgi:dGTPase
MLDLTEPLVEAMCLAHDLGHTPFGHAGEDELKQLLKPSKLKWNSNAHSLRVVEELELQYCGYRGLNLTWAVREGLARHKTTYDAPTQDGEYMKYRQPSLEAQVASIADLIAYSTHDIEDALLAGLLRLHDLGYLKLSIWEISWTKANDEFERAHPKGTWLGVDKEQLLIKRAHRHLIDYLIRDVVAEAKKRAQRSKAKSIEQARSLKRPLVAFSAEAEKQVRKLLDFMLDTVYKGPIVARQNYRASFILNSLFKALSKDYRLLPTYVQERMDGGRPPALEVACFLAGLTDRSAADLYAELFAPTERAMGHRMI